MEDNLSLQPPSSSDGENGGSTLKRNHSETRLITELDDEFDPYKALERTQSDASLLYDNKDFKRLGITMAKENRAHQLLKQMHYVSESSKVYLDLSKAELTDDSEDTLLRGNPLLRHSLEPIPQKEELSLPYSRTMSNESLESLGSSTSHDSASHRKLPADERAATYYPTSVATHSKQQDYIQKSKNNLKSLLQTSSSVLRPKIKSMLDGTAEEQIASMEEILGLIEKAWATPVYGKDLAYGLCDVIRHEGGLDLVISNLSTTDKDLLMKSAKLLEQIMTTRNRDRVAKIGLKSVVKMTVECKGNFPMARITTGILESIFKHSEETCHEVIKHGGLDSILYWCRCSDNITLRHCAIGLANLAIYGGSENQQEMIKHKAPEWLFPLAFSDDDSIRYYACLAISTLVANKEIEAAVINSGSMDLVLPFIAVHRPDDFAKSDRSHIHGRSKGWLRRLLPVLSSKREEAQSLAAFHFAMEAGIKKQQQRTEEFYDIGAIEPLKKLASSPNTTASKLAADALKLIGEEIPHKLKQQVPLWTVDDVVYWVTQISFGEFSERFRECQVDGDLLLLLTEADLQDSIHMQRGIMRKRFLRELKDLKITADYTSCDQSKLDVWLIDISPDFTQYTYQLLQCGVDKCNLCTVTDENLRDDCGIANGIHRRKIVQAIQGLASTQPYGNNSMCATGGLAYLNKPIDVFISYRRSSGSQLASLLKVHLQLRGFSVFLDIERLRAGKFDEGLLNSVRMAKHFILVLTPNALDRCIGDSEEKDWVHREIVAALDSGCNIVPLLDNFEWPSADTLPEDMRAISYFNAVRWIHDYQDACVDKLERFLCGEMNNKHNVPLHSVGSSHTSFGSADLSHGIGKSSPTSDLSDGGVIDP